MTSEPIPEFMQPQWFLPLFAVMWFVVTGLLSHLGGWASLASTFAAQREFGGERFRFASGSLGGRYLPVQYGNCLFVTVSPEGLRLSILFVFRFLSPPLFIPWSEVTSVEEKRIFFFKYYVVNIRDHWSRITLRGSPGRRTKHQFDASKSLGRANK